MREDPGVVLVAEDTALLAELLRDAFAAHGVGGVVEVYRDGLAALDAFRHHLDNKSSLRLLVLDIGLPGMEGLELGREARQAERERDLLPVPIVFFSARSEDDEVRSAIEDCFPARFVQKAPDEGPAKVALEGARLIRDMLERAGR